MTKPLAIDLCCGLGGWAEGLLAEGWDVIGYDTEAHDYGTGGYPGTLVLQDITTLHGSQFTDVDLFVASPPCQKYSYMAMPWSRAKAQAAAIEADLTGQARRELNLLFDTCFRLQCEASEAAGRHIPLILENVRGVQKWVGRSAWHYGNFHLWGDVPALMPVVSSRAVLEHGIAHRASGETNFHGHKNDGGSWFNIAHNTTSGKGQNLDGRKTTGHANIRDGHTHTRHLTNQRESDAVKHDGSGWTEKGSLKSHNRLVANTGVKVSGIDFNRPGSPGFNVAAAQQYREGVKQPGISGMRENGKGDKWFQDGAARHGSKSNSRKAASAMIAKIPFPLAQHIARSFYPAAP